VLQTSQIATSRISATKSTSKNSTKTMTKNQLKHVTTEATPFFKNSSQPYIHPPQAYRCKKRHLLLGLGGLGFRILTKIYVP